MVVVQFPSEVTDDMALLSEQKVEVITEFCKLAMDSITTGAPSKKVFAKAAGALQVEAAAVEKAIGSLAQAFLECAKRNVSAADFKLSLGGNVSSEGLDVISETYAKNFESVRNELQDLDMKLPHYHDLDWRLDVQVASRCMLSGVKPKFVLELQTKEGQANQERVQLQHFESDYANLKNMCDELEVAIKESKNKHCNRIVRYVK